MIPTTEPIYSYVKGQGWVINPLEVFTLSCGTKIVLEERWPEPGECFVIKDDREDYEYYLSDLRKNGTKRYRYEWYQKAYGSVPFRQDYDPETSVCVTLRVV